jgi:hypothetical protein
VTISGAGFEAGADVVWDPGGAGEDTITPDTVTATQIVAQLTAGHLLVEGSFPVTVRNPGPSDCATVDVVVKHMLLVPTGQILCENTGWVACSTIDPGDARYGQDGHYDNPPPGSSRYADNADGTVSDYVTGLMWQQATTAGDWQTASDECDALSLAGHDDWRLPRTAELATLQLLDGSDPYIDSTMFPDTDVYYWADDWDPYQARIVDFTSGITFAEDPTQEYNFRCVRLDTPIAGTFEISSLSPDRVVEDTSTGLMWQGCPAGKSGDLCESGTATMMFWPDALAYCEDLSWGGFDDWRMPNRNELATTIDYEASGDTWIDQVAFPNTSYVGNVYWSSSTAPWNLGIAFGVQYDFGYLDNSGKESMEEYVRCVRAGP